ncbi:WD40-repeat-containing domain protein [Pseudomassariella vexata]|uniref:WD40-repeat-containing domain protein n=1 Tax=Pseudomassariella vexata TaxID=1141098 RepID=A0A1Y2E4T8_9PEZI|nr:WD40-repeat-containing domain protein [Pseudomassariella vexata]ORY65875.1 WD40-repeat-containing domain protein [Pseudomassariella vexata]
MSALESSDIAAVPDPPAKRRKLLDDSADSTPRYDTPEEPDKKQHLRVSIREKPLESRSASVSRSPDRRKTDYSSTDHSSLRSRSRSRTSSRSRLDSRSRSRSRSHSRSSSRSRSPRSAEPASFHTPHQHEPSLPPPREPTRPDYQTRLVMGGHQKAIAQVRISPDGRWIASASADGTIKLWEASTGRNLETLVGHMAGVSAVAWSPDSTTLASGSDDKAIRLWNRVTGKPATKKPLWGHHNYVYSLAFSPKGNILASGSYDEAVFLWDVRAGRLMRSLPAHSDPVSGIDFSSDGTLVVSSSTDGLTRIWDTSTGQCLRTMVHEDNPAVTSVCFAPNGRYILTFSMDSCLRLWDYVSGSVKKTYQGHENSAFSIGGCFVVVDGEAFVAAASENGDIVLWDVKSKEIVQRIKKAHDGVCFWVDAKGDTMVSCGKDGKIKLYKHRGPKTEELPVTGIAPEVAASEDEGVMPVVEPATSPVEIKKEE